MAKKSGTKPFVYATIIGARVVAESSKTNDGLDDIKGEIEIEENGQIEIKWEVDQNGSAVALTISPHIEYAVKVSGKSALDYTCNYEVSFEVSEIYGFEAKEGLPQPAAAPYVDFAVFLARQHATKSIRSAGVSKFAFADAVRSKDLPYQKLDPSMAGQKDNPSAGDKAIKAEAGE